MTVHPPNNQIYIHLTLNTSDDGSLNNSFALYARFLLKFKDLKVVIPVLK